MSHWGKGESMDRIFLTQLATLGVHCINVTAYTQLHDIRTIKVLHQITLIVFIFLGVQNDTKEYFWSIGLKRRTVPRNGIQNYKTVRIT